MARSARAGADGASRWREERSWRRWRASAPRGASAARVARGRERGRSRASMARARAWRATGAWRELRRRDVGVHVKLDTGMGRLGTRDPAEATRVAEAVAAPGLRLAGAMTHFATADDDPEFMARAARALPRLGRHVDAPRHAANSAAALGEPAARLDMIRCGIAIYGMDPFHRDPADHGLEPALELVSYVAEVKRARTGESAGYGRRFVAERDTWIGTIPIGYGDGFRRGLTEPLRGRSSAAAASRASARSRWTTSPSTSATSRSSAAPRRS